MDAPIDLQLRKYKSNLHNVVTKCLIPQVLVLVLIDVTIDSDTSEDYQCDGNDAQSDDGFHYLAVSTVANYIEALHLQMDQLYHSCNKTIKSKSCL